MGSGKTELMLPQGVRPGDWPLDFLVDYIVNIYHRWLPGRFEMLRPILMGFIDGHRKKYPYLDQVAEGFTNLEAAVNRQLRQGEEIIFPYIRQIASMHRQREPLASLFVKTLRKPLNKLVEEQEYIRQQLALIREATGNYQVPDKTCSAHQLLYDQLQQFEACLAQYAWLETDVLFPRAMALEKEMLEV